jgi:hypothetical protein
MRAQELEGPYPEANQLKRPRNTPPTNQRQTHGFKGPPGTADRLTYLRITEDH